MPSVIMERSVAMSERSHADCSVTKLRLAAVRKPSASKPSGMPQFCEPARPEPISDARALLLARRVKRHACCAPRGGPKHRCPPCRAVLARHLGGSWRSPRRPGRRRVNFGQQRRQSGAHHHAEDGKRGHRQQCNQQELAKPAPKPSELASQARPRPAARPPSMAPQGRFGSSGGRRRLLQAWQRLRWLPSARGARRCRRRCGVALGDVAGLLAQRTCHHPCAWHPHRDAQTQASPPKPQTTVSSCFSVSVNPLKANSALDSNMQSHNATSHVVIVHMPKAAFCMRLLSSSCPGCIRMDSARYR
jgi:hypothetical protein